MDKARRLLEECVRRPPFSENEDKQVAFDNGISFVLALVVVMCHVDIDAKGRRHRENTGVGGASLVHSRNMYDTVTDILDETIQRAS